MSKRLIFSIIVSLFILSGCSDNSNPQNKNTGTCGLSTTNKNLVDAYNNETCESNIAQNFISGFSKEFGDAVIPKGDEGKDVIAANIEADPSKRIFQEDASATVNNLKFSWQSITYTLAIMIVLYSTVRQLIAFGTLEMDEHYPEKIKYNIIANLFGTAAGILMISHYPFEKLGENETSTFTDKYNSIKISTGMILEAGVISTAINYTQIGKTQANQISESSKVYSPTYYKSKNIAFQLMKGQLRDDVTAKTYYQKMNMFLPNGHRIVDFQEIPNIYKTENGFVVKRLIDGHQTEDYTLSELWKFESTSDAALPNYIKEARNKIKGKYLTNSASQMSQTLADFKVALMADLGLKDSNQNVNNAVQFQALDILNNIYAGQSLDIYKLQKELSNLAQEHRCTQSTPDLDVINDAKKYIMYLYTGDNKYSNHESKIGCVATVNGSFVTLGSRNKEVIYKELKAKFKELVDLVNINTQALDTSIVANTVDESNSKSCVLARQLQGVGFAIHYRNCLIENQANKEIMQTAQQNYRIIANGDGNYIDTNYALRNNADKSNLFTADFDPIMNEVYNSISMKVELSEVDNAEYLNSLIDGNLGDESSITAVLGAILDPTTQLRKTMGLGKECEARFYNCLNPVNAYVGLNNMADKMIDVGFYTAFFSVTSSTLMSKFTKQDDKSMKLSKSKKGSDNKFKAGLRVIESVISMFSTVGFIFIILGYFIKLVLALPVLLFAVCGMLVLYQIIITLIIGVLRFTFLLMPNDRNNFMMNFRKLINEFAFDVSIKAVLVILQVVFYPVLGFSIWLVCYAAAEIGQGGMVESIVCSLAVGPMVYLITVNITQGFVNILDMYIENLAGNVMMAETLRDVISKYLSIVTFGLPIAYIFFRKRTQKKL